MTGRAAKGLAIVLWAISAGLLLLAVGLILANPDRTSKGAAVVATLSVMSFPTVGALIASRRPANPIGWLYLTTGLAFGIGAGMAWELSWWSTATGSGTAGMATRISALAGGWWALALGTIAPFSLLLFPDGHLPSRRWRPVAWIGGIGIGMLILSSPFVAGTTAGFPGAPANPLAGTVLGGAAEPLSTLGALLWIPTIPIAAIALVLRLRRAAGTERDQIKWFAFGGAIFGVAIVIGVTLDALGHPAARENVLGFAIIAIPVSAGIAMLRHRLYDIDIVIRKTVAFAILVLLLMIGSLLLILLAGIVVVRVGNGNFWSPEVAIPVAFMFGILTWPLLRVSNRIADRVVYGGRSSAYEVLSEFSERMRDTYEAEDVLTRMAAVLAGGTRASEATVWLRVGDAFRPEATWPDDATPPPLVPEDAVEIVHQGELLGALSVRMPANDPLGVGRRRLMSDLAAQAGPVLRNVGLIEELRDSRRRIVAAQDQERRKIERNIHDGAQQQLVALQIKQRLVGQLIERDPPKATEMIEQLQMETATALDDLRDLARGIYPPLLADQGLTAAVEAQARKAAVPTTVETDGIGRYPPEVEATVYFCTLEALNNIAKYSEASLATVTLSQDGRTLTFVVRDDGRGFEPERITHGTGLQGMADRLAAVDGRLSVTSAPGEGTTVRGMVPTEATTG